MHSTLTHVACLHVSSTILLLSSALGPRLVAGLGQCPDSNGVLFFYDESGLNCNTGIVDLQCCTPCQTCDSQIEYEASACTGFQDRVCDLVTDCDYNTTYRAALPTLTSNTDCQPISSGCASSGQYIEIPATFTTDRICGDCPPQTFQPSRNGNPCSPWRQCADGAEYLVANGSSSSDTVCRPVTECTQDQYFVTESSPTSDRVCAFINPGCPEEGLFISTPATATSDNICSPCTDGTFRHDLSGEQCIPHFSCEVISQYEVSPPTSSSDRQCAEVSECSARSVEILAPTPSSNRICAPACPPGEYVQQVGNVFRCEACPGGTFKPDVVGSTCRNHSNCAQLYFSYIETQGTSTTDNVCAPTQVCTDDHVSQHPTLYTDRRCGNAQDYDDEYLGFLIALVILCIMALCCCIWMAACPLVDRREIRQKKLEIQRIEIANEAMIQSEIEYMRSLKATAELAKEQELLQRAEEERLQRELFERRRQMELDKLKREEEEQLRREKEEEERLKFEREMAAEKRRLEEERLKREVEAEEAKRLFELQELARKKSEADQLAWQAELDRMKEEQRLKIEDEEKRLRLAEEERRLKIKQELDEQAAERIKELRRQEEEQRKLDEANKEELLRLEHERLTELERVKEEQRLKLAELSEKQRMEAEQRFQAEQERLAAEADEKARLLREQLLKEEEERKRKAEEFERERLARIEELRRQNEELAKSQQGQLERLKLQSKQEHEALVKLEREKEAARQQELAEERQRIERERLEREREEKRVAAENAERERRLQELQEKEEQRKQKLAIAAEARRKRQEEELRRRVEEEEEARLRRIRQRNIVTEVEADVGRLNARAFKVFGGGKVIEKGRPPPKVLGKHVEEKIIEVDEKTGDEKVVTRSSYTTNNLSSGEESADEVQEMVQSVTVPRRSRGSSIRAASYASERNIYKDVAPFKDTLHEN